jgi:hypothetical protein
MFLCNGNVALIGVHFFLNDHNELFFYNVQYITPPLIVHWLQYLCT